MERLTRKSLEYKDTWIADGSLSNIEGVVRGNAIDRLAELEDVLEKYGIENLEEYISALMEARKLAIEEARIKFKRYKDETIKREKIERQLAELKQKAIVPQFKPNDDAYIIWNGTIIDVKISSIVTINEYIVKTCHSDLHHDGISCIDENEVFATREEAEQKLAQLKGKE